MNDYAKLRDLMICGNDQMGLFDGKTFGEYVLFASGRPVIVVPLGQDGPLRSDLGRLGLWPSGRKGGRRRPAASESGQTGVCGHGAR